MRDLAAEFKDARFVGVHSNANESQDQGLEHFKGSVIPFPVLRDPGARLADSFGALKTPHAFVLRDGRVVFEGGVDDGKITAKARRSIF